MSDPVQPLSAEDLAAIRERAEKDDGFFHRNPQYARRLLALQQQERE